MSATTNDDDIYEILEKLLAERKKKTC